MGKTDPGIWTFVRGKLVETASREQTIGYMKIGVGRRHIGAYLHRVAVEEGKAGRPPLTAVAVREANGRPGDGFREALRDAGYIQDGDPRSDEEIWRTALREVHAYWRPRFTDDGKPLVSDPE